MGSNFKTETVTWGMRLRGILGYGLILLIGFLLSKHRDRIRWRTVLWGLGLQAIFAMIDRVKNRLDAERQPNGYNIGINVGRAAGQTVFHLHVHVIPRYEGDVPDPRGGVRFVIPEKANYLRSGD